MVDAKSKPCYDISSHLFEICFNSKFIHGDVQTIKTNVSPTPPPRRTVHTYLQRWRRMMWDIRTWRMGMITLALGLQHWHEA